MADHPEFVEPVHETVRYEAPLLVDDPGPICTCAPGDSPTTPAASSKCPTGCEAAKTAVIMVHPWGIDDGQGWRTPEPAGAADFCTPEKNHLAARHTREVINPFLKSLRGKVSLVMYSLPGNEDPIRKKMYRSFTHRPSESRARARGRPNWTPS